MKICPKTGVRYDHTPSEWAEHLRRMAGGAGMSLPASIAARIHSQESRQELDSAAQDSGPRRSPE
jgi:hypothetical protein